MTNKPPKYQHYLPESYLNGFVNQEGLLAVYDKKTKITKEIPPKVFGGENHFYTIETPSGEKDTSVEDMFVDIDGTFITLLRKLKERLPLSSNERKDFALILSLFFTRTPYFRSFIERSTNILMKPVTHMLASNKSSLKQWEKVRKFALDGEYTISPNKTLSIQTMIEMAIDIAPIFDMYNWYIGITNRGTTFMTTDNPITLIPEKVSNLNFLDVGFLSPGVTIHFPLSKELMFGVKFRENHTDDILYGEIGRKDVRSINHDLYVSANRYVLSRDITWLNRINKVIANE